MSAWRLGIVGAGGISRNLHLPVLLSMPRVRVDWIADAVPTRAAEAAQAYRLPRALGVQSAEDLPEADVVLLAIPPKPRANYYRHLARRGTAVFAEKPFALCEGEHIEFQSLFSAGRIGCGYMRRYFANNRLMRRIVREGWFGPLTAIRVAEGGRTTKTGVESSYLDLPSSAGGGIIHDYACHTLDLLFELAGAREAHVRRREVVFDGQTDRRVEAEIELPRAEGGAIEVDYTCSWLDRQPNQIELQFANVTVKSGTSAGSPVRVHPRGEGAAATIAADDGANTLNQAFFLQWSEFLDGVGEGRDSRVSAAACLPVTRLVDQLLDGSGTIRGAG